MESLDRVAELLRRLEADLGELRRLICVQPQAGTTTGTTRKYRKIQLRIGELVEAYKSGRWDEMAERLKEVGYDITRISTAKRVARMLAEGKIIDSRRGRARLYQIVYFDGKYYLVSHGGGLPDYIKLENQANIEYTKKYGKDIYRWVLEVMGRVRGRA
jgi:hypothetical protein